MQRVERSNGAVGALTSSHIVASCAQDHAIVTVAAAERHQIARDWEITTDMTDEHTDEHTYEHTDERHAASTNADCSGEFAIVLPGRDVVDVSSIVSKHGR